MCLLCLHKGFYYLRPEDAVGLRGQMPLQLFLTSAPWKAAAGEVTHHICSHPLPVLSVWAQASLREKDQGVAEGGLSLYCGLRRRKGLQMLQQQVSLGLL